jgi:hypothetical protein
MRSRLFRNTPPSLDFIFLHFFFLYFILLGVISARVLPLAQLVLFPPHRLALLQHAHPAALLALLVLLVLLALPFKRLARRRHARPARGVCHALGGGGAGGCDEGGHAFCCGKAGGAVGVVRLAEEVA